MSVRFYLRALFELLSFETSRGAAARSVTVKPTGCGFDPHSRRRNIYLYLYFHFFALVSRLNAALSSVTQHAMPPEFGRKWGTECLNTRFPLPTLLCAGYSVKLFFFWSYQWMKLCDFSMNNTDTYKILFIFASLEPICKYCIFLYWRCVTYRIPVVDLNKK